MNESQAYENAVQALIEEIGRWSLRNADRAPRFQLAPMGIMVIAPLGAVAAVCVNDDARECVRHVVDVMRTRYGRAKEPTVFMFDVALQYLGIEVDRVALSALGLKVGAS
jgi:hypothetical protein